MRNIAFIILFHCILFQTTTAQKQKQTWRDRYFEFALTCIEKNTFRYNNYIIERVDAEKFNFEDSNIKFNIFIADNTSIPLRIYNTSSKEMICRWERALFVIEDQSYSLLFSNNDLLEYYDAVFAPRYIAPQSFEEYWMKAKGPLLYKKSRIKKYGPAFLRLLIPIEVNGEEVMYDFKYKISLDRKKK